MNATRSVTVREMNDGCHRMQEVPKRESGTAKRVTECRAKAKHLEGIQVLSANGI
jgi:hypothetical protein